MDFDIKSMTIWQFIGIGLIDNNDSDDSRRTHNPEFYVSGKRLMRVLHVRWLLEVIEPNYRSDLVQTRNNHGMRLMRNEFYRSTVKPVYNDHLIGYFSAFWQELLARVFSLH